tara:strand:+ start:1973 stop:2452 length:480 start_codon:yes stop_codon:yes gene_type:complete
MADEETGPERAIGERRSIVGATAENVGTGTGEGSAVGTAAGLTSGSAVGARVDTGGGDEDGVESRVSVAAGVGVGVAVADRAAAGVSEAERAGAGEDAGVGGVVSARVSSPAQAAKTIADTSADAIKMDFPEMRVMVELSPRFERAVASYRESEISLHR